jgi:hypothetical protein
MTGKEKVDIRHWASLVSVRIGTHKALTARQRALWPPRIGAGRANERHSRDDKVRLCRASIVCQHYCSAFSLDEAMTSSRFRVRARVKRIALNLCSPSAKSNRHTTRTRDLKCPIIPIPLSKGAETHHGVRKKIEPRERDLHDLIVPHTNFNRATEPPI